MTVPVWPTTLPEELLQRGYNQACPDVSLRTSMEVGPAKVRRRSTAQPYPVKGVVKVDESQLGTLREFYDDDLLGGTLRFSWKEPITLAAKEFRFTAPPNWSMTGGWFDVRLEFEVLP